MYFQYSFGDPLPTKKLEWRDLLVRWGLYGGVNYWGGVVTSDTDFRDYLARRKVNKCTQTYYRAPPYLTIYKLRRFFIRSFK